MFGVPEEHMQEAEKLCDLFDRLRKYAIDNKITCVIGTRGIQPAHDVTDVYTTWQGQSLPKVMDYIGLIRANERPLSMSPIMDKAEEVIGYDITVKIGYSALREGVEQKVDPTAPRVAFDIESNIYDTEGLHLTDWIVPAPVVGHCKECGSEIPYTKIPFVIKPQNLEDHLRVRYGKGTEVTLPSGMKVMVHIPTHERLTQLISGLDQDFEPCKDGDVIILGGGEYRVTRPHHDYFNDDVSRTYPHRVERLNFPGMGGCWPMGDSAAPTPERAAAKRRQSDVHVNGKPKKSWQR